MSNKKLEELEKKYNDVIEKFYELLKLDHFSNFEKSDI